MGCLGEMTCNCDALISNMIAFQRALTTGHKDDLMNWYSLKLHHPGFRS